MSENSIRAVISRFNFWIDLLSTNCARFSKARKESEIKLVRINKYRINHALYISALNILNLLVFIVILSGSKSIQTTIEGIVAYFIWIIFLHWLYLVACMSFAWNINRISRNGFYVYDSASIYHRSLSYFWCLSAACLCYVAPSALLIVLFDIN